MPKRLSDINFVLGMPPGRNMGAIMVVALPAHKEYREAIAGPPTLDANQNITAGGIRRIDYRVTLEALHMAEKAYGEDAADDIDQLIEAIIQRMRIDRTLGGICTQAGEGKFGIQTRVDDPEFFDERTYTQFRISFECMTQIIA